MKVLLLQEENTLASQKDLIMASLAELGSADIALASSVDEALSHEDARVLVTPTNSWFPQVLHQLPDIEWIHFLSSGVDSIWSMNFEVERYALSKSAGVHASAISEYVLGAIMYITKGFGQFARQQSRREWRRFWLEECTDKTLGIIGVGAIGSRVAKLAKQLGMKVVGVVHSPRELENVDAVFGFTDISKALSMSDFVALLVPLTAETWTMIGTTQFGQMRGTAWLINAARGEVVDETALVEALRNGEIAGAVLDVFEREPLPDSSPLWDMDNVLITPHVAGTTDQYMVKALEIFKDNYRAYQSDGSLISAVSFTKGY